MSIGYCTDTALGAGRNLHYYNLHYYNPHCYNLHYCNLHCCNHCYNLHFDLHNYIHSCCHLQEDFLNQKILFQHHLHGELVFFSFFHNYILHLLQGLGGRILCQFHPCHQLVSSSFYHMGCCCYCYQEHPQGQLHQADQHQHQGDHHQLVHCQC